MYSVAMTFLLAGHEALERDRSKEMRHFEDVTKALDIFLGVLWQRSQRCIGGFSPAPWLRGQVLTASSHRKYLLLYGHL